MNFRIEQALLIVDPKGFLFDQIVIPVGKQLSPQEEYSKVCKILISNWTLYTSDDIVNLDWALGKLRHYLTTQINKYNDLVSSSTIPQPQTLLRQEQKLVKYLELLSETTKRIFFYQIHISCFKFFNGFSIASLYLSCDNFKILKIVSEIEVKFLQQQSIGGIVRDQDKVVKGAIAKIFASSLPFAGAIVALFNLQSREDLNLSVKLVTKQKKQVDIKLDDVVRKYADQPSSQIVKQLGLAISKQDEIKLNIYFKIVKKLGDYKQLSYLIQLSKNMYLTLQETSKELQQYWMSLYKQTEDVLMMNINTRIVSINQILKYPLKSSRILQIMERDCLSEETMLSSLSFVLKNTEDGCESKAVIKQKITSVIQNLIDTRKWQYSQGIFEVLAHVPESLKQKVFAKYYSLMMNQLQKTEIQIFQLQKAFIHFFKFYFSGDNIEHCKKVINQTFFGRILQNLQSKNEIRITHFIFNQLLYFCQGVAGFDHYMQSLFEDSKIKEVIIQIYSKFLKNNKCLFKLNLKLIHKLIDNIYEEEKENHIDNIEVCSLYWQTNAKFLLFWGFRSYLQDELYGKQTYLENILFKILELIPQLTDTYQNQEKQVKRYLQNKQQYNQDEVPHWLNLLAYKNRSLGHNLLYSCLFLRDCLTGYQFKTILELMMKLFTPLVNITTDSLIQTQFSFQEEIEIIASQFALQVLETVCLFKIDKNLSLDWVKQFNSGIFRSFWKADRQPFINLMITLPITSKNYDSLTELRRFELNLLLFNSVMQKLNSNAIKQISQIKTIQTTMAHTIQDIEYQLAPIFWQECLEDFYQKSLKLRNQKGEKEEVQLRVSLQKEPLTKNNSSLGFERLQITDKYLLFKYFKVFFETYKIETTQKNVVEKSVRRVIEFVHTNPDVEYTILATQIELIYVIQKYCAFSSQNEKKLKFSLLSPIVPEELEYIIGKFNLIVKLVESHQLSLVAQKMCNLLVRQLNKYFIAYVLHDCISFHHHYSQSNFNKMLEIHMRLQKSILLFIKTISQGCQQSHNVYLQVLDSNISLYTTVIESNQNQDIKQPLAIYGNHLAQFTFEMVSLMMYSTFTLKSRCRSSILHIFASKYQLLTKVPKSAFNRVFGGYLTNIFKEFLQFDYNEKLTSLFSQSHSDLPYLNIEPISHLSKIQLACTQAMIINLLGRNNYTDMCTGIGDMFQGKSTISYINYLLILTDELSKLSTIKESNLQTLTVDVFGSLDYILSEDIDYKHVVPLLIKILNKLDAVVIGLKSVKSSIVKYIVKSVVSNPSPQAFQLLKGIQRYGYQALLPRVIQLQSELLQFKSPLHILNVLYYDKHNFKNIRLNWAIILENYSQDFVHQFIDKVRGEDSSALFLCNYQRESPKVSKLIEQFVRSCLSYMNELDTINECYLLFQTIISIGVKFPALINQIYQHRLQIKQLQSKYENIPESWKTAHSGKSSINFLEFVLDLVEINHRFLVQFIHFALRTNSGFKITEQQTILSNNLLVGRQIYSLLLQRLEHLYALQNNQKKLASIFGTLKCLEHLLRQGENGLFKLYNITSPPRQSLRKYHNELSKPLLQQIYNFIIKHFEESKNPLIQQTMVCVLGETLKRTLEKYDVDSEVEENIKYYLNNYLFSILQGYDEYQWALNKQEKVETSLKTQASDNYQVQQSKTSQRYHNSFLSMEYNIFKQDQHETFQAQNQLIASKLQMLGLRKHISKLQAAFKEVNSLAGQRNQLPNINHHFPTYDQTKKAKNTNTKENNLQFESPSTSHMYNDSHLSHENSGDYILDCDSFIEDGIVGDTGDADQIIEDSKERVSSFQELISGTSDTAVKQLIRRVNKLEIMEDLEQGKEVGHKLQFLSNDELLKLSSLAQGKLLLEIEHEKQFRGFAPAKLKYGNTEYQQPVQYRYLDELYPGCRKVTFIHQLIEEKQSLIPEVPQSCLLKIFQMFVESLGDEDGKKRLLKIVHVLCLNPKNMMFFANTLYFALSIKQNELPLLKEWFGWMSLDMLKFHVFELMSHLFENRIGLVLWILGEINLKTLQLNKIKPPKYLQQISQLLNRQQITVRLIELAALNINFRKPEQNLQKLLEVYNQYLEQKEGRYNIDYPWFDTPELALNSTTVIQELVTEILMRKKRIQEGSVLELLFKLLLKIYPGCYETIMLHFFHQASVEVKKIVDHQHSTFKKFLTINGIHSDSFNSINKNQQLLIKVVESYSAFMLEKNTTDNLLKETSHYLKQTFNDIYLGVLPWFKEWRFRVQNREELGKHFEEVRELKEKVQGVKIVKNYDELEKVESELRKLDHRLKDWKSEHKNEFLKSYIKPIHECFSVNLLASFKKSVDLLEQTGELFNPTEENFKIVEPAYRNQSIIWQMILAFMSVYLQESTNSYHTMSKLVTREHLKDEEEHKKRRSRKSRKSIRMSLVHTVDGGLANISLMLRLGEKITLVGYYLKEGSELIKALAQYGTLDIKLKSIKRKKSGIVKEIQIDRSKIWFDSIINIDEEFIQRDIRIKFKGEIGIDYGGLTKQWLTSITQQLFNPNFGLFELSANKLTIQPSKFSHLVPQHLMHFRKLGLLVGKALIEDWTLEINFTKSFLKHLLGNTIYVEDLFDIDPDTAKSLVWILDNEVNEDLDINFCIEEDALGSRVVIPLMQNGQNIMVNESNKKQYVKAVCKYKMTEQIRPQAKAFMEGLEEVVPYDILKCMTHKQLGLYLAGMPKINVDEMQQHAKYNNYGQSEQSVKWLWEVLREFDEQQLANFLFFVSGSFKVPYGGFKEYPLVINRGFVVEHLPVAHTCFNTLDLPPYASKLDLKKKLNIAISEGKGFGVS